MAAEQAYCIDQMNRLGRQRTPFLFIIDFAMQKPVILPLAEVKPEEILYNIDGKTNVDQVLASLPATILFEKQPVSPAAYQQAFVRVMLHLRAGNSFLVNLTFPTEIQTNLSLRQIFFHSRALYKLLYQDQFVVFSPETFIKIEQGLISSHPMKGTIDTTMPDAEKILLNNQKELAEHITIVDLIRNDMSMMAAQVKVEKFRYIDRVKTHDHRELLQVSSKITGLLPTDYHAHLGDIIFSMLPAGSISGAPKPKTLEIIREAENYHRGYYTGITGIFDGENLDSGVMIRFIEKQGEKLYFKSGGGITAQSDLHSEYQELIDKVYVPIDRIHQDT